MELFAIWYKTNLHLLIIKSFLLFWLFLLLSLLKLLLFFKLCPTANGIRVSGKGGRRKTDLKIGQLRACRLHTIGNYYTHPANSSENRWIAVMDAKSVILSLRSGERKRLLFNVCSKIGDTTVTFPLNAYSKKKNKNW